MSTDLSLVPAVELADELMRRCATGIVMVDTVEQTQVYVNWAGDYYRALGFCQDMQRTIMEDSNGEET